MSKNEEKEVPEWAKVKMGAQSFQRPSLFCIDFFRRRKKSQVLLVIVVQMCLLPPRKKSQEGFLEKKS